MASRLDRLTKTISDKNYKAIYGLMATAARRCRFTEDGMPVTALVHSEADTRAIRERLFNAQAQRYVMDYGSEYETPTQVRDKWHNLVKDSFYNPVSGIGTSHDPLAYASSNMPLLMSPEEATSLYANGGIAEVIINKKSKGIQLNGYTLKSSKVSAEKLKELQEYADNMGFSEIVADVVRDGMIYGGAIAYPVLNGDTPVSFGMTAPQLFGARLLQRNCLSHFAEVDRWNTVVVPEYDITAKDYLNPTSLYVPISGIEVHRDRMALVRPKKLPYWGALRNLGWGVPDTVGYLRALMGYEITMMSIPIMCQQMSLLYHVLPLDGIIAQNGPEAAKRWQRENEKQLRDWSIVNPKAINSFGEIGVVNRSYGGFDKLIDAMRKDVSSKCGIPESVIFFAQQEGLFNKGEEDVLLKQSETIRLIQRTVAPTIDTLLPYVAVSLWGLPDGWTSFEDYKTIQIGFDTPVVSSPSQKAEIGKTYAETIEILFRAGLPLQAAVGFATKVIGEVELPSDYEAMLTSVPIAQPQPVSGLPGEPMLVQQPQQQPQPQAQPSVQQPQQQQPQEV